MSEPYVGQGGVIGIAMNADNGGTYWGGAPAEEVAVRPYPGTMKWTESCKQAPVADLRVDEGHNVTGGVGYSGSIEIPACYLGLVLPLQGILCGDITTSGATAPYTHAIALADKLAYCRIAYYEQMRDGTPKSKLFGDAAITALTLSCSAEAEMRASISWAAATLTPGAEAIPTPVALEPILWDHIRATFDGVTTHRLYSIKLEFAQPVTDQEFQMAAADTAAVQYLERSGQRTMSVEAEFLHDAGVDALAAKRTSIPISIVCDNGATAGARRALNITIPAGFREGRPETGGAWGVKKTSLKWFARQATAPYSVTVVNGDNME